MTKKLLVNAMQTPDGTYLESRFTQDYKEYLDTVSGETYMVDGGLSYSRQSINIWPAKMITVYDTDPHHHIRKHFRWGTYGVDGNQPRKLVALKDLTTSHITAILNNRTTMNAFKGTPIHKIFLDELTYRVKEGVESPEEGSY